MEIEENRNGYPHNCPAFFVIGTSRMQIGSISTSGGLSNDLDAQHTIRTDPSPIVRELHFLLSSLLVLILLLQILRCFI
jgi:hypothetical protein